VLFGPSEVIVDAAADPIIIRVHGGAVAHDLGDCFKRFGEWFHREANAGSGARSISDSS
jgi:hypothetical protein